MSYSKWNSRRWWVCLWAIVMVTSVIVWLMVFRDDAPSWVGTAISLFQLIIGGYIAADSFTKPKG